MPGDEDTSRSSSLDNVAATGPPINRLPENVLARIFRALRGLNDEWGFRWYRLLWVCRLWRASVQGDPALWHEIRLQAGFSQGFLEDSLKFSKDHPIDVSFYGTTPTQNAVIVGLLLPHVSRIRSLHARNMGAADDRALSELLGQKMPILQDVSANFKTKSRPMGPYEVPAYMHIDGLHTPEEPFLWDLRAEQFPALRHLYLGTGLMLSGPLPVFPGLKRLELFECRPGLTTIAEFGQLLAQLVELEELCIHRFRPAITPGQPPMALPPSLRKLSLEDNAYYTRPFLASFAIPADVDLKIVRLRDFGDLGDLPPDYGYEAPSAKDALPTDTSTLPILKAATAVEVRHYASSSYSLRGTTRAGRTVRVTGELPEGWDSAFEGELNSFNDLVDVFADAPVDTLFLNGNDGTVIDEEDWAAALDAWPGLERITIAHTDSLSEYDARLSLLDALLPPELAAGEDMADVMPAPLLETLTITSPMIYTGEERELARALVGCLRARKDAGYTLPRLHIKLEYIARPEAEDEAAPDNRKRARVFGKPLKKFVQHLEIEPVNAFYPENYVLDDGDDGDDGDY